MNTLKRSPKNPIITREQITGTDANPELRDVSSVFNPGAIKFEDEVLLMLRVQTRSRETCFMTARSKDGESFEISQTPVFFEGIEQVNERIYHCYDPRITRIGDTFYIMFAMDMDGRCELGLGWTADFETFKFMGVASNGDNRNGVLFPEKINSRYLRLDRPNRVKIEGGATTGDTIVLSASNDLLRWNYAGRVISGRWHYWDELVGAGPPPIKTREGWLQIYHGVATHLNAGIYQAGVMLLDLMAPENVTARGGYNILEPRDLCETVGQVPNVVFPGGAVVEEYDDEGFAKPESRVLVYYGAADTSVCMAHATIAELIDAARTPGRDMD